MNKFFKSKLQKGSKIVPKEVKDNNKKSTEVMGSIVGKLTSNFCKVNNGSNDSNCNNDSTGVDKKHQDSLKQPVLGITEKRTITQKEKKSTQILNKMVKSPMEDSSFKSTTDKKEETFKRAEVEETLIRKQSKILITKGADDKIIVARKIHTTEKSIRFTKNYLNDSLVNASMLEGVEVSSTTEDNPTKSLESSKVPINASNVSFTSNKNLKSKELKTYKNAHKIVGLNDSSESDSTIVLVPRKQKKYKKIVYNRNGLSQNQKPLLKDEPKLNSLVDKKSENFKKVHLKKNVSLPLHLNKKLNCKGKDISKNSIEHNEPQNIITDSSFDSDPTVLLTPVEQNKSQTIVKDKVNDKLDEDFDSVIFSTPIEEPENRKKKMNEAYNKLAKKESKNPLICENVSSQSTYETSQKFSSKALKERLLKIFQEEKFQSLGFSSQELEKKIVAIFKDSKSDQADAHRFSSRELKEKVYKILEEEESANLNKSPSIDKLRRELAEIFGDDVSSSQIEPPPTLSTQELLNILKSSQSDNAVTDASAINQSEGSSRQDSFKTVHSSLISSTSVQSKKTEKLTTNKGSESKNLLAKTTSNKSFLNKNLNADLSRLDRKRSLSVEKHKTPGKNKALKISKKTSSEESKTENLEVVEKINETGLENSLNLNEELEDTLKINESADNPIVDDTLKLPEVPQSTNYELAELMNLDCQDYDEESDNFTDSSLGRLVIDESTDDTPEFMDVSNINEIAEDLVNAENDPFCINNENNQDPLDVAALECENPVNEQENMNSLNENEVSDSSVRLETAKADNSSINVKKLDKKRELFILLERVDVDKFKEKNCTKVVNNSKARSSLRKKISMSIPQVASNDLFLKKELRVRLERLRERMNQNTSKIDSNKNLVESKGKAVCKLNDSLTKPKKIVQQKDNKTIRKTLVPLKEVRIILTPIKWKDYQDMKKKQTNNLGTNDTLTSSLVDDKSTRKSNNEDLPSFFPKRNQKFLDQTNSEKKVDKKKSRSKQSSKVVKNTNSLVKNRKVKSNLKTIINNFTLIKASQQHNLKELKVTLERISARNLVAWRKKN